MKAAVSDSFATMPHVLVIDDDERIRDLVTRFLTENDFVVCGAPNTQAARDLMKRFFFDALVVDIMMPGEDGLSFTRAIREKSDIPVLLLTARGETEDRITGLETGADDYLTKPFEPRELVLRLQSILRRVPEIKEDVVSFRTGRWLYDPDLNELRTEDETVRLTTVEGNLIKALARFPGEAVGREDLAKLCGLEGGDRSIDVQVTRLRRKLEDNPRAPRYLQTVRGKGYLLRIEDE